MPDVSSFLDIRSGDIKDPVLLTAGEYLFRITSYKAGEIPNDKKTPVVTVSFKAVEVIDSELSEEDFDTAQGVTNQFYMSPAAQPYTKRWLVETVGIDDEDGDKTMRVLFEESIGMHVRGFTKSVMRGQNKDRPGVEIDRFATADLD